MSDAVQTAIIAAIAAILGSSATFMATMYSARQKLREIELTFGQKLQENYLASARLYTRNVYVPLSMALTRLSKNHRALRRHVDFEKHQADENASREFHSACDEYFLKINEFYESGSDAFFTSELEERLLSFNDFLEASLEATEPVFKATLRYDLSVLSYLGLPSVKGAHTTDTPIFIHIFQSLHRATRFLPFGFTGGFTRHDKEVLASPLWTREFHERMVRDLPILKSLIKEVTLGMTAASS